MKKQLIMIGVFMACFGFGSNAQIHINIGIQPIWGPVGYDEADYYYLPDIDAYYDVPNQQYIYLEGSAWVTRPTLPPRYANYDLYGGHKVVINEPRPWLHDNNYRTKYSRYKGMHDQHAIRDSRNSKYYANPGHPRHNEWHGNNAPNNGHNQGGNHGHSTGGHPGGQPGGHPVQQPGNNHAPGHPGGGHEGGGHEGGGEHGGGHEGGEHGGGHGH